MEYFLIGLACVISFIIGLILGKKDKPKTPCDYCVSQITTKYISCDSCDQYYCNFNGDKSELEREKQIPKEPRFYNCNYYCPVCDDLVGCHDTIMKWDNKFCKRCGQAIKWE